MTNARMEFDMVTPNGGTTSSKHTLFVTVSAPAKPVILSKYSFDAGYFPIQEYNLEENSVPARSVELFSCVDHIKAVEGLVVTICDNDAILTLYRSSDLQEITSY